MSALRYLLFSVVVIAASLKTSNALAISHEEVNKFREAILPHINECSEKFGVNDDDFEKAREEKHIEGINPCFFACVFKKANVINDEGLFEPDNAIEKGKKLISNPESIAAVEELNKDCASVNDLEVSDAEAGCQRSKVLLECFLKHKNGLTFLTKIDEKTK